jgi:hypothetical protein
VTDATLNRRRVLAGTAAALSAPAAAVPTLAAAAGGPHPDAALLALGESWQAARALCKVKWTEMDAALDRWRATRPPVPADLFEQPGDKALLLPAATGEPERYGAPAGSPPVYQWGAVMECRDRMGFGPPHPPRMRDRAAAIVKASDAFDAADRAAERVAGLDIEDDPELDALCDRLWSLTDRIMDTPAATLDGLLVKAREAAHEVCRDHAPDGRSLPAELDTTLERVREEHGRGDETALALAIVRDLLRLGEAAHG